MKVLFICGSVEAGKDGVGDYTMRLARQLILQGNHAAVLAVNDSFIIDNFSGQIDLNGVAIPALRLVSTQQLRTQQNLVSSWIEAFNPEWCSLQFVPFAFHPKGLPHSLASTLAPLISKRSVHIMFHELWVGLNKVSSRKEKLWGWFQKNIIETFIAKLKPVIIHTQSQVYIEHLKKSGFFSKQLPLFGNIPISAVKTLETQHYKIVIFGGIHPGSPVANFAEELSRFSNTTHHPLSIVLIGRSGSEQDNFTSHYKNYQIPVEVVGEQPAEVVSALLSSASFGLTTTPLLLIEKSGSVAAMLEHGLSVLCLSKPWYTPLVTSITIPPGIVMYNPGDLQRDLMKINSPKKHNHNDNTVASVADLLIQDLFTYSPKKSEAEKI